MKQKVIIQEGGLIRLPDSLLQHFLLQTGDKAELQWDPTSIQHRCFHLTEENDEAMFEEGFYCIPDRILNNCSIDPDEARILEADGCVTITTGQNVLSSLGPELIACLMLQNVDLSQLADDLIDCMNDLYEDEHLQEGGESHEKETNEE